MHYIVVYIQQQIEAKFETKNQFNFDLTSSCLAEDQKGKGNTVLSG